MRNIKDIGSVNEPTAGSGYALACQLRMVGLGSNCIKGKGRHALFCG